ncbi:MAG: histidine phosphatase family protein [Bacteroidetes bacterium]|nr:histidine phosphatase family protein [Bacteroidota bacterium]
MKNLCLLRHAKSSWKLRSLDDFDRPLNNRGIRDAPFMGEILLKKNIFPELIISSPALRAITTAKIIAEKLKYPVSNIKKDKNIYEASALDLLSVIKQTNNKLKFLMLVGHNPGITYLINLISDKRLDNLPTAGIVCLKKEVDSWEEIDDKWSFEFIEYPKKYKH